MAVIHHPGQSLVIGHRGAAAVHAANTLPSIRPALALGVDAIEFDVRVTADGVAVVHHDASTGRTCGTDLVIAQSTIAQLRALNAAATFVRAGQVATPTVIPLLDEVLALTEGTPVIVECKTTDAVPHVLAALTAHRATERAIVGSFLHGAMQQVRAAGVQSGASRRDMVALMLRSTVALTPSRLPFAAMCIPERSGVSLPIARFARWGNALGVPVHIWTVNRAEDARRLWDLGVTGVISDDPEVMLRARATRAAR